jgi:hypothetical protein
MSLVTFAMVQGATAAAEIATCDPAIFAAAFALAFLAGGIVQFVAIHRFLGQIEEVVKPASARHRARS